MSLQRRMPLESWHEYFVRNSGRKFEFSSATKDALTSEERRCIEKSIAAFQLGEHSEGRSLLRYAEDYARACGDGRLVKITRLFIAEEQHHALLLKKFMQAHGIELLQRNWTDDVFRRLRKNVGYELSITVLITAEIISLVYYMALHRCTGSQLLQRICERLLADERAHIRYESEMILHLRESKTATARRIVGFLHRFLFCGTVVVVYCEHRRVLRRGGYNFARFWRACWSEFANCFKVSGAARVGGVREASQELVKL